ncbi:hypothetical protein SEA_KRADAL_179 [Streptomyces phage Kradal]|nr:hypothetical protein SEA_KRADAL_179 [Streptomyces phage Kradal]
MAIPTGAYAVTYKLWLFSDTDPEAIVDTDIEQTFPLSTGSGSSVMDNEDAAAEAAMGAWKASMEGAYPGVTVNARREYLIRSEPDTWPWSV